MNNMATKKQQAYKAQLIKRLHTVVSKMGLSDDQYRAALNGFGVSSSKDLDITDLLRLIDLISTTNPDEDMWRKRCIAAIGAWLRSVNRSENIEMIKAVACRATHYNRFNQIPKSRLRDLYFEFVRKAKVSEEVEYIVKETINFQTLLN